MMLEVLQAREEMQVRNQSTEAAADSDSDSSSTSGRSEQSGIEDDGSDIISVDESDEASVEEDGGDEINWEGDDEDDDDDGDAGDDVEPEDDERQPFAEDDVIDLTEDHEPLVIDLTQVEETPPMRYHPTAGQASLSFSLAHYPAHRGLHPTLQEQGQQTQTGAGVNALRRRLGEHLRALQGRGAPAAPD